MKNIWTKLAQPSVIRSILIFAVIFGLGYSLRSKHPEFYPIGFDQIQILQNAQQIQQGHFVLLGPRTGPAPMFTGPLIYYIAAALLHVTPAPYVLVTTSLALYTLTFLAVVFLTKRYLNDTVLSWLFAAIYAFSPYQVSLDRVPWNPNITFLAAVLVFIPLLYKAGKKLGIIDLLLIMLGCFLGYQAHFSGLILPGFVLVAWLIWYRRQWWLPMLAGVGVAASLLPTALFDYRHQYLNAKGLLFILTQRGSSADGGAHWWNSLYKDVLVTFENMGKIPAFTAPYYILVTIGVVVILLFAVKQYQKKASYWWPLIWIFGLDLVFMFYKGQKPEYYFLLQFPALFYVLSQVIKPFIESKSKATVAIAGFGLYSIFSLTFQQQKVPSLYLGNQMEAAERVRAYHSKTNSIVVYDMKDVATLGLKYLLSDLPSGAATSSSQSTHLIYPYFHDSPVNYEYGELAVWQDPRTDSEMNYLVRKEIIIKSPRPVLLLEDHYPKHQIMAADSAYVIEQDQNQVGKMYFVDDKMANGTYNDFMDSFKKQWDKGQQKWQLVTIGDQSVYVRSVQGTTLIMVFADTKLNSAEQLNFLNALEIL